MGNAKGDVMLSDEKLVELITAGSVTGVKPTPDWYTAESPVQASSLDLHVGDIYLPGKNADEAGGENHPLKEYNLKTGETVLIKTQETLSLPKQVGGIAFPPSRFAVKALLVTNAGHVDPEYRGPLRFTVINMGHELQKLSEGERVGTLILFRTETPPKAGWYSRTQKEGKAPTTADLNYLSKDFAEVVKRAEEIARQKVQEAELEVKVIEQRWNHRFGWVTALVTLIGAVVFGVFSFYSPVSRSDTRIDSMREEFTQAKQIEDRLQKLESAPKVEDITKTLKSLDQRTTALEKKVK
jgi:deoxycytidine triphosphate deaminase